MSEKSKKRFANRSSEKDHDPDYQDFLFERTGTAEEVPSHVWDSLQKRLEGEFADARLLRERSASVESSAKLGWPLVLRFLGIHALVALASLVVCPQFGVRFGGRVFAAGLLGPDGLMGVFMRAGPEACSIFCGGFFILCSLFGFQIFLSRSEKNFWLERPWAVLFSMVLVSLGAFWMLRVELLLDVAVLWALGGFGFGMAYSGFIRRLSYSSHLRPSN